MDGGNNRAVTVDSRRGDDLIDNTVIDQIMLRYRPIAPRPVSAESSRYTLPADDMKRKRVKRKYVKVKKKVNKEGNLLIAYNGNKFDLKSTVTNEFVVTDPVQKVSNWISFGVSGNNGNGVMDNIMIAEESEKLLSDLHGVDLSARVNRNNVVESWITMESVTGTCEDRRMIGYTDDEIWKNLERESCPGFITNGYDEVVWVNPAYKRMLDLDPDGGGSGNEVVVWLMVKVDRSIVVKYLPAFSCRVRIEFRSSEKKKKRMMVPGDVCKMDAGGFAWLLDVRFALSLGPLK